MSDSSVQPADCAPYHYDYVMLVRDKNINTFLHEQKEAFTGLIAALPEEQGNYAYAPGKWTIKQVIQHVIDTERIFSFRLLALARGEHQHIPGFEQDDYAAAVDVTDRTLAQQRDEFDSVRRATQTLLSSLTPNDLAHRGTISGFSVAAKALPYILAGHVEHHVRILKERYGV